MSRNKTNTSIYWFGALAAVVLILAIGLWVWPSAIASPVASPEVSLPAAQEQDPFLDVAGAYQKYQQGALMLDVRTPEEWQAGHIPGATLIPLDQLSARSGELPPGQEIVIYCRSGNRSAQALSMLKEMGWENISSLEGGINDWIASGYEVVAGQ